MKKLKFLFVALVLTCFVGINQSNAQAEFYPVIKSDVWTNITDSDLTSQLAAYEARALVTPGGIVHLKAYFQIEKTVDNEHLIPKKGSKKVEIDYLRFRYDTTSNTLFEERDFKATINSEGVVKVVLSWSMK